MGLLELGSLQRVEMARQMLLLVSSRDVRTRCRFHHDCTLPRGDSRSGEDEEIGEVDMTRRTRR